MQFAYRGFNIECFAEQVDARFVGHATISRASIRDDPGSTYETGYLPSCATLVNAIGDT